MVNRTIYDLLHCEKGWKMLIFISIIYRRLFCAFSKTLKGQNSSPFSKLKDFPKHSMYRRFQTSFRENPSQSSSIFLLKNSRYFKKTLTTKFTQKHKVSEVFTTCYHGKNAQKKPVLSISSLNLAKFPKT